jgi:membrane protease YdiL (CAAX protease family)
MEGAGPGLPASTEPDPDNPPWNVLTAFLTWLGSVVILVGIGLVSLAIAVLYIMSHYQNVTSGDLQRLVTTDKTAVFITVVAVIPVHLLTLALVWFVVTGKGRRPFWRTLGWKFNHWIEPYVWILVAILLLGFGYVLTKYYGGEPTDIDQIINNSAASRLVIAFLATATAPLVEEVVYRGILYPALQRAIGVAWAIAGVAILFTSVHYIQYQNNLGVLAAIGVLSLALTLVRAYTGRLLPCFIIHLVFNGVQSLTLVLQPYFTKPDAAPVQQSGLIMLAQILGVHF